MVVVVWPLSRYLGDRLGATGVGQIAAVAVPVVVGGALYLGAALAFHVEEVSFVRNLVSRRTGRG